MLLPKNFLKGLIITLLATSCAAVPRPYLETCLTDPRNNALHCDGTTKHWGNAFDYVCHPLAQWEKFMKALP